MRRRNTHHRTPRTHRPGRPLVELTRVQATGAVLGLLAISVVVFIAGVVVGRSSTTSHAHARAPQAALSAAKVAAAPLPGTQQVDDDLSRPLARIVPRNPTDAARIETYRQLAEQRRFKVNGVDGPATQAPSGEAAPLSAQPSVIGKGASKYALQVSAFESSAAASVVAGELEKAGHDVRVDTKANGGRKVHRILVGSFDEASAAAAFQRRFEERSGYSTVLVPE